MTLQKGGGGGYSSQLLEEQGGAASAADDSLSRFTHSLVCTHVHAHGQTGTFGLVGGFGGGRRRR